VLQFTLIRGTHCTISRRDSLRIEGQNKREQRVDRIRRKN